jgi:hypothetical protein
MEVNKWVSNPFRELTKVIEITVHYVETYAPIVGQIFGVILKGYSKLSFAMELIGLVISAVDTFLDSDLLKNMINHFVLIFNERKTLSSSSQSSNSEPNKKRKKGFFNKTVKSIRESLR